MGDTPEGRTKPHLEILSEESGLVLKGRCSACPDVIFSISSTTTSALAVLHGMFSEHSRQVHGNSEQKSGMASD
jgi:hypothetical protein